MLLPESTDKAANNSKDKINYKPKLEDDIREILNDKKCRCCFYGYSRSLAYSWCYYGNEAGKHVYVEKPCSHNMFENELVVAAQKKYNKVVQMGNQQRSSPNTIEIINEIHNGVIGTPYKATAFYTNGRGEVPSGKRVPVPKVWTGNFFKDRHPGENTPRKHGITTGIGMAGIMVPQKREIMRLMNSMLLVGRFRLIILPVWMWKLKNGISWMMVGKCTIHGGNLKFSKNRIIQWDGV